MRRARPFERVRTRDAGSLDSHRLALPASIPPYCHDHLAINRPPGKNRICGQPHISSIAAVTLCKSAPLVPNQYLETFSSFWNRSSAPNLPMLTVEQKIAQAELAVCPHFGTIAFQNLNRMMELYPQSTRHRYSLQPLRSIVEAHPFGRGVVNGQNGVPWLYSRFVGWPARDRCHHHERWRGAAIESDLKTNAGHRTLGARLRSKMSDSDCQRLSVHQPSHGGSRDSRLQLVTIRSSH